MASASQRPLIGYPTPLASVASWPEDAFPSIRTLVRKRQEGSEGRRSFRSAFGVDYDSLSRGQLVGPDHDVEAPVVLRLIDVGDLGRGRRPNAQSASGRRANRRLASTATNRRGWRTPGPRRGEPPLRLGRRRRAL